MQAARSSECDGGRADGADHVSGLSAEPGTPQALDGQPSNRDPDGHADDELPAEEQGHVADAVTGHLDPVDEPDHEQHSHRVVQPRLPLERPRDLRAQTGMAKEPEDRGGIGNRDDRAEQHPLEQRDVEHQARGGPRDGRGHQGARDGEPD